jgi:glycosyltransferase involved in cell wall biosynthesis
MRVLMVAHGFPPAGRGGTEIYTHDLACVLAGRFGDRVHVLAREADPSRPERALRREQRDRIAVSWINNTFAECRSFEETYRDARIRAVAETVLDDERPDVVHVQHLTCLSTDVVEACARRGLPVVVTLNDYWLICQRGQLLDLDYRRCDGPSPAGCARCLHTGQGEAARRLQHVRAMSEHVALFLAPSETLRRRFLAFGWPSERLVLARQGCAFGPTAPRPPRTSGAALRLGFLGSLMVSKAPHLVLEAIAHLPAGSATLDVFGAYTPYHGDDGYRRRLDRVLRQDGVRVAGPLAHADVPRALADLDVLVVPSVWEENAPFVIREALQLGVPVVASDLGGMAEMVEHGRNGLLFPPGDARALERALRRLVDEPLLLDRLRAGIGPVRSLEEDAAWTREQYRRLAASDGVETHA